MRIIHEDAQAVRDQLAAIDKSVAEITRALREHGQSNAEMLRGLADASESLVPRQATFARFVISRRAWSLTCRLRQAM